MTNTIALNINIQGYAKGLKDALNLGQIFSGQIKGILSGITTKVDTSAFDEAIKKIQNQTPGQLNVENSQAVAKANQLQTEIKQIPSTKTSVLNVNSSSAINNLAAMGLAWQGLNSIKNAVSRQINGLLDLHDAQIKAERKVEVAVRQTGMAAGFTSDKLKQVASNLQQLSGIGDEEILNGVTAQLLTFTNISDEVFLNTQQAVLDVATVLDADLKSTAIQLGKALNDPLTGLTALNRSGIQFTASQKQTIKTLWQTGQQAKAQGLILKELNRQYGGQAQAQKTFRKELNGTWGDVKEKFGGMLSDVLKPTAGILNSILATGNKYPGLLKAAAAATLGLTAATAGLIVKKKLELTLEAALAGLRENWKGLAIAAAIGVGVWAASTYVLSSNQAELATNLKNTNKAAEEQIQVFTESQGEALKRQQKYLTEYITKYGVVHKKRVVIAGEEAEILVDSVAAQKNQLEVVNKQINAYNAFQKVQQNVAQQAKILTQQANNQAKLQGSSLIQSQLQQAKAKKQQLMQTATEVTEELKKSIADIARLQVQLEQTVIAEKKQKFMADINYFSSLKNLSLQSNTDLKNLVNEYVTWAKTAYAEDTNEYRQAVNLKRNLELELARDKANFVKAINALNNKGSNLEEDYKQKLKKLKVYFDESSQEYQKYLAIIDDWYLKSQNQQKLTNKNTEIAKQKQLLTMGYVNLQSVQQLQNKKLEFLKKNYGADSFEYKKALDDKLKFEKNFQNKSISNWKKQHRFLNSTYRSIGNSFGSVFNNMLIKGQSLTKSLKAAWKGLTQSIIRNIGKMIGEWITAQLVKASVSTTTETTIKTNVVSTAAVEKTSILQTMALRLKNAFASIADAIASGFKWLVSTLGPFGLAAGIGLGAGIIAGFKGLLGSIGFAGGGYTGDGGRFTPAGVVHKGEVVFEAPIVKNNLPWLMWLRSKMQNGFSIPQLLPSASQIAFTGNRTSSFASGGYASNNDLGNALSVLINKVSNLSKAISNQPNYILRTVDDIELAQRSANGNKKLKKW